MSPMPSLHEKLSPEQCHAYECLAASVVRRTVNQYARQLREGPLMKSINPSHWKLLKTRENIKIYRSRRRVQPSAVFVESLAETAPKIGLSCWMPKASLLCVGTLAGTLEAAMFGAVTPAEVDMTTRSAIIHDEFVERGVLQDMKIPTVDNPFEYLGLKWAKRSSRVASIVRARDIVFVEASGFHSLKLEAQEERVGYLLYHSVEPDEVDLVKTKGAVRARYSMCLLFRQLSPRVTEMYLTVSSDPGGNIPPKLAAMSAASALIACAGVMECALIKTLSRRFVVNEEEADRATRVAVVKMKGSHWLCVQCTRSLSSFHSLNACEICRQTVCSRCTTTTKLVFKSRNNSVALKPALVCKGCITSARNADLTQLAIDEFVLTRSPTRGSSHGRIKCTAQVVNQQEGSETALFSEGSPQDVSFIDDTLRDSDVLARTYFRPPNHPSVAMSEPELLSDRTILCGWESGGSGTEDQLRSEVENEIELVELMPVRKNTTHKLLRRMTDLTIQAEETYYYTKNQSWSTHPRFTLAEADIRARQSRRAFSKTTPPLSSSSHYYS